MNSKQVKYWKLFLLFFFAGFLGIFGYLILDNHNTIQEIISPISNNNSLFSLVNAPKDSTVGNIISLSGTVSWQSRISDQLLAIKKPIEIQQGESLQTGQDGKATVLFTNYGSVDLSANSNLEFIQTLPANFVFNQPGGTVSYEQISQTPISIRTLGAVTKIDSGVLRIKVDQTNQRVDFQVKSGEVTVGFNDVNFVSQVITVKAGQVLIYDDKTRTDLK